MANTAFIVIYAKAGQRNVGIPPNCAPVHGLKRAIRLPHVSFREPIGGKGQENDRCFDVMVFHASHIC